MKSLKRVVAEFTCTGCKDGLELKNGHHVMYCGTPKCRPGIGEGHFQSCTSQAGNKEFLKAIRTYFELWGNK